MFQFSRDGVTSTARFGSGPKEKTFPYPGLPGTSYQNRAKHQTISKRLKRHAEMRPRFGRSSYTCNRGLRVATCCRENARIRLDRIGTPQPEGDGWLRSARGTKLISLGLGSLWLKIHHSARG